MRRNLDSPVHHQAEATTAELLEAVEVGMVALLDTAVGLPWAVGVEVANSMSPTFVAPSSTLITAFVIGVLTCTTLAPLQRWLARHEGSIPTGWCVPAY